MCEERVMRVKKNMRLMRVRNARRMLRLSRTGPAGIAGPPHSPRSETDTPEDITPIVPMAPLAVPACPAETECARSRNLIDIAMRTVALMKRNRQIQIKLADLQKETAEYITLVMRSPESRCYQSSSQDQQSDTRSESNSAEGFKLERDL